MIKILLSFVLSFFVISSAFANRGEVPQQIGLPVLCYSKDYVNLLLKEIGEEIQLVAKAYTVENLRTIISFSFNPDRKVWTLFLDTPNGQRCIAALGEEGFIFK
jgi:hypothetical protein